MLLIIVRNHNEAIHIPFFYRYWQSVYWFDQIKQFDLYSVFFRCIGNSIGKKFIALRYLYVPRRYIMLQRWLYQKWALIITNILKIKFCCSTFFVKKKGLKLFALARVVRKPFQMWLSTSFGTFVPFKFLTQFRQSVWTFLFVTARKPRVFSFFMSFYFR